MSNPKDRDELRVRLAGDTEDFPDHSLGGYREAVLPIRAYEVDGQVYRDVNRALEAAAKKTFEDWYLDNTLYGSYEGCRAEARDILEWLEEHREEVTKLLKMMV
jgi:hypothetical protein